MATTTRLAGGSDPGGASEMTCPFCGKNPHRLWCFLAGTTKERHQVRLDRQARQDGPRRRGPRLVDFIVSLLAVLALMGAAHVGYVKSQHARTRTVACVEDQSCWDCATMGNRVCGPEVP